MRRVFIILLAVLCIGYVVWNQFTKEDKSLLMYGNVDIREASPSFEIVGKVASIQAYEGQEVQAGAILATLDKTSLELELKRAQIAVASAKLALEKLQNGSRPEEIEAARAASARAQATAALASRTFTRKQKVYTKTKGAGVSQAELDEAQRQKDTSNASFQEALAAQKLAELGPRVEDLKIAQVNLEAANNEVAVIKDKLAKTVLRAPAKGTIRNRFIEIGDLTGGSARAYALALTSEKRVRVYAYYGQLSQLHLGAPVKVYFGTNEEALDGTISYISAVAEFTPKNVETQELRPSLVYEVQAIVTDPQDLLRLGMPVTVKPVESTEAPKSAK